MRTQDGRRSRTVHPFLATALRGLGLGGGLGAAFGTAAVSRGLFTPEHDIATTLIAATTGVAVGFAISLAGLASYAWLLSRAPRRRLLHLVVSAFACGLAGLLLLAVASGPGVMINPVVWALGGAVMLISVALAPWVTVKAHRYAIAEGVAPGAASDIWRTGQPGGRAGPTTRI